jgi:hypothetical protein
VGRCQLAEGARHVLGPIAHQRVTPNEVGVGIDQDRFVIAQTPRRVQVEKYRTAPDERFNVSAELAGVIRAQLR